MSLNNIILEICNLEEFFFAFNRLGARNIRENKINP